MNSFEALLKFYSRKGPFKFGRRVGIAGDMAKEQRWLASIRIRYFYKLILTQHEMICIRMV